MSTEPRGHHEIGPVPTDRHDPHIPCYGIVKDGAVVLENDGPTLRFIKGDPYPDGSVVHINRSPDGTRLEVEPEADFYQRNHEHHAAIERTLVKARNAALGINLDANTRLNVPVPWTVAHRMDTTHIRLLAELDEGRLWRPAGAFLCSPITPVPDCVNGAPTTPVSCGTCRRYAARWKDRPNRAPTDLS